MQVSHKKRHAGIWLACGYICPHMFDSGQSQLDDYRRAAAVCVRLDGPSFLYSCATMLVCGPCGTANVHPVMQAFAVLHPSKRQTDQANEHYYACIAMRRRQLVTSVTYASASSACCNRSAELAVMRDCKWRRPPRCCQCPACREATMLATCR